MDRTVAVIPAAGMGIRMGAARAKQFIEVDGVPLLAWTLAPFQRSGAVDALIVVIPAEEVEYCDREIVKRFGLNKVREGRGRRTETAGFRPAGYPRLPG